MKMEQQKLIERLKQCEEMPLFRKIIIGDTSFIKEINNFYNCEPFLHVYSGRGFLPEKITSNYNSTRFIENYKVWPSMSYKFQNNDISKHGTYPVDLISILNHISDTPFDIIKLQYEKVNGEKRSSEEDENLKKKMIACGAIATTAFFLSSIFNHLEIGVSIEALIIAYMLSNPPQPPQNQLEINELNKLVYHAQLADSQMWTYRLNILKEKFDK